MNIEEIIYKNTCSKWLNKPTREVVYLDKAVDLGKHNPNWFSIPTDAQYATYSNNNIRSDVLLFWKFDGDQYYCLNQQSKEWFRSDDSLELFLTDGTYKGEIIWSLFK